MSGSGEGREDARCHNIDVLHVEDEAELEADGHSCSSAHSHRSRLGSGDHSNHQSHSRQGSQGNPSSFLRHRGRTRTNDRMEDEEFVFVDVPENEVEAQRMEQNHMFGFKKWKSHVTRRPLQERSEVVQELYKPPLEIKPFTYPTLSISNVIYALLIGWFMALIYALVGLFMLLTVIAWKHGIYCFKLGSYFLWPFGYFVQEQTEYRFVEDFETISTDGDSVVNVAHNVRDPPDKERLVTSLTSSTRSNTYHRIDSSRYWKRPSTYIWLILGVPFVFILHLLAFFISWMTVIFLPVAKLNMVAIKRLLFLPPEKLKVSKTTAIKPGERSHEVIMCSYQAANFYSYKYTVDGMNIFFVNMLLFVVIAVVVGFADYENRFTTPAGKFVMGLLAIIPLAHYIGMAIASISAQSNHVVGAVLNATFGSIVEIVLYISSLIKQRKNLQPGICYSEIVKSALTGTLLATMLFIPGICMMIGGLKHKEQRFNVRSMSVSATLLFISVVGVFTPTIFTITLGGFECSKCFNSTNDTAFQCMDCTYVYKLNGDSSFLYHKLRPLVYVCITLLFLAYVIGLIFSLKTHAHIIQGSSSHGPSSHGSSHSKTVAHWGRIKSTVILLISVVLMALNAEIVVQNLEPILPSSSPIKPVFIGVTVLAVVPDLPEIINGIQFALKNNISLSLEIGCSVAVQVCLLQIPVLVVADAIANLGFNLVFNDLHLWSVVISVIIINYIFVDGKSDYFQGCMLCIIYFFLLAMFYFAGDSTKTDCSMLYDI